MLYKLSTVLPYNTKGSKLRSTSFNIMTPARRRVGPNGPSVNAISYGLMTLGHAYGHAGDTPTRLKLLDELYQADIRCWDGADVYADIEELIGHWFTNNPGKRGDIFLATKVGLLPDRTVSSSPEYIKQACNASLNKLKTSYIDLLYIQRVDQKVPIEKIMQALSELKK